MKKDINRITFFNFLSILLLQGIAMISAPLFSRLLGTSGYGSLASFTAWSNMACIILSLQSNETIVNARQEYDEQAQPGYQSSIMALSILGFLVGGGILMVFAGLLKMERLTLLLILMNAFGIFAVNFLSSKFTYEFKADKNMLLSIFMSVANFGVSLLLVLNMPVEQRYYGRMLGGVISYFAVGAVGCIWILAKGKVPYRKAYWKLCLTLGIPLIFQNLAYALLGSSDILMLEQLAGASASGIYSYALTMAGIIFTIFTALNSSWVPFFYDDMKQGRGEAVRSRASHFLELYTVLCAGFILLVREVFCIYADKSFWNGAELIPIFVVSYFVNMLCTFPVNFEILRKKTTVVAASTVAAALVNLVLNYVLIRAMGMTGAALATLLARVIQLAMHEWYTRCVLGKKDYPFPPLPGLKCTAALAVVFVLFYVLKDVWLLRWGLGAAIGLWELKRIRQRKGLM